MSLGCFMESLGSETEDGMLTIAGWRGMQFAFLFRPPSYLLLESEVDAS